MNDVIAKNNEINLCDTCEHMFPSCNSRNIIFGTGKGNDNVAACSIYKPVIIVSCKTILIEMLTKTEEHFIHINKKHFNIPEQATRNANNKLVNLIRGMTAENCDFMTQELAVIFRKSIVTGLLKTLTQKKGANDGDKGIDGIGN